MTPNYLQQHYFIVFVVVASLLLLHGLSIWELPNSNCFLRIPEFCFMSSHGNWLNTAILRATLNTISLCVFHMLYPYIWWSHAHNKPWLIGLSHVLMWLIEVYEPLVVQHVCRSGRTWACNTLHLYLWPFIMMDHQIFYEENYLWSERFFYVAATLFPQLKA